MYALDKSSVLNLKKHQLNNHALRKKTKDPVKSERLQLKVYEAVTRLLLKHRSGTFTLDEVASEIGMSKGIIYYYFKSKGEIIYKLNMYIHDIADELSESILADQQMSPRKKLEAAIKNMIVMDAEHWQISRALWSDMSLRDASAVQAGIINKRRRINRERIGRLINQIIVEEGLQPIDLHMAEWFVYGIIVFTAVWFRKRRNGWTDEEVSEFACNLIFNGLFTRANTDDGKLTKESAC